MVNGLDVDGYADRRSDHHQMDHKINIVCISTKTETGGETKGRQTSDTKKTLQQNETITELTHIK